MSAWHALDVLLRAGRARSQPRSSRRVVVVDRAAAHLLRSRTDVALLARALEWMATDPRCANEAFNVVNGDAPRWSELWTQFARALDIEAAGPRNTGFARHVEDKGPVWDAVVRRHRLQPTPLHHIALWDYGDYVLRPEWDIMSSMNKARCCGFEERVDTTEMFARVFAGYRVQRIIP